MNTAPKPDSRAPAPPASTPQLTHRAELRARILTLRAILPDLERDTRELLGEDLEGMVAQRLGAARADYERLLIAYFEDAEGIR